MTTTAQRHAQKRADRILDVATRMVASYRSRLCTAGSSEDTAWEVGGGRSPEDLNWINYQLCVEERAEAARMARTLAQQ